MPLFREQYKWNQQMWVFYIMAILGKMMLVTLLLSWLVLHRHLVRSQQSSLTKEVEYEYTDFESDLNFLAVSPAI